MRLIYHIALLILLFTGGETLLAASGTGLLPLSEADSVSYASLDKKLEEYCSALRFETVAVQIEECDFLIASCTDSLVRQHIASTLYRKYRTSKLMGVEAVAIHILDKWFFSDSVRFEDEIELLDARIYADFNRQSLVGCRAAELELLEMDGTKVSLFVPGTADGRFKILYFYDVHCPKCKMEAILLRSLLENEDYPVDFYAVYTGSDESGWRRYVDERFDMNPLSAEVTYLWDPQNDSDFQHKFGVLQTPGLFLIAPDNTILGRALDARALALMLKTYFEVRELEYGSAESSKMLDTVLGDSGLTEWDVRYFADHLADTTLPKGDTTMFRQMSGDLLYYLSSKPTEASRNGLNYLLDNYILNRPDIWKSADDSLKIIGMAQMMDDLLKKSQPGTKISGLKVPAELYTWKSVKNGKYRLDKLRGRRNIIIFYTDGCANCNAQKKAATDFLSYGSGDDRLNVDDDVLADAVSAEGEVFGSDVRKLRKEVRRTRVLMVNVDEILSGNSQLASELFDSFDLSTLPYIVLTDEKGIVLRRYVSLI